VLLESSNEEEQLEAVVEDDLEEDEEEDKELLLGLVAPLFFSFPPSFFSSVWEPTSEVQFTLRDTSDFLTGLGGPKSFSSTFLVLYCSGETFTEGRLLIPLMGGGGGCLGTKSLFEFSVLVLLSLVFIIMELLFRP
jgi:hypothetical protein